MADPDTAPEPPEPPRIRQLRRLVMALTLTLTLGMITIVGLLAWRLTASPPLPSLPETLPLPPGETLTGYGQTPDWIVLITIDARNTQRLHLMRPGSTLFHQSVTIDAGN